MSSPDTTSTVSLADMPDLPLTHIISYIGFRSLQSLRLVSKPLCHFIDTEKPSVQIDDFCIKKTEYSVKLILKSCGLISHLEIRNHGRKKPCSRSEYYEELDYLHNALNLIKYVFNTQTTQTIKKLEFSEIEVNSNGKRISEFTANWDLLRMFEKFLTDQRIILRVRELSFEGHELHATRFLPFFDSNILKSLIFRWASEINATDNLMRLEQWKNAKFLFSTQKIFRVSIRNFGHFETAKFCMRSITAEDLIYLKENYSQSPHFTRATIHCPYSVPLLEVFGEPLETNKWIFRCADPNFALVFYYRSQFVRCYRTHISNTTLSAF